MPSMDEATKTAIVDQLNELIIDLIPDATMRPMYGGTVIEMIKNDPKSRIGGVFIYADYVSLELSNGASFSDPDAVLEGKGKFRRHVKLRALDDLIKKDCKGLLRQASSLP